MALEAGSQMHEVFSAVRLWQVMYKQQLVSHANYAGDRLFPEDRWLNAINRANEELRVTHTKPLQESNYRDHLMSLTFAILHGGPFYDDPADNIRTIENMEKATIGYVDHRLRLMDAWPIWIEDKTARGVKKRIGVEQVFDVVLEYSDGKVLRYIGTIDGLTLRVRNNLVHLEENKTASRLDDGWRESFKIANQVTAYCASVTSAFGIDVWNCYVTGVKIKPGAYGDNIVDFVVPRTPAAVLTWGNWVRWTVEALYEPYIGDRMGETTPNFEDVPRFTHSCNRYFRPCNMIPFCDDTPEGRLAQWEQMVEAELSPSEKAVQEI